MIGETRKGRGCSLGVPQEAKFKIQFFLPFTGGKLPGKKSNAQPKKLQELFQASHETCPSVKNSVTYIFKEENSEDFVPLHVFTGRSLFND